MHEASSALAERAIAVYYRVTMNRLAVIATAIAALLPSSAQAATTLPVGRADGVRASSAHGAISFVFTERAARLWKAIAGKRVKVACVDRPDHLSFALFGVTVSEETLRVPRSGRRLTTNEGADPAIDYCRVWRTGKNPKLIVSVPLTQLGAVFLDEQEHAFQINSLLIYLNLAADDAGSASWPAIADVVKLSPEIVALADPSGAPPAGKVGYWSDGGQHVVVATLSTLGRRLFIEYDADDRVNSNVGALIGSVD